MTTNRAALNPRVFASQAVGARFFHTSEDRPEASKNGRTTNIMQKRFRRFGDRQTDLSGGYEDVCRALHVDCSIEPEDDERGLTDAQVDAYAQEARSPGRAFVRDWARPTTAWMAMDAAAVLELRPAAGGEP